MRRVLVKSEIPHDEIHFVETPYNAHRKNVHEARRVPELEQMNVDLIRIIRKVYTRQINNQEVVT